MHLVDAFIQSDLQCIQVIHFFVCYVCSLGIEPTTSCAANAMLYHWATGTLVIEVVIQIKWPARVCFQVTGRQIMVSSLKYIVFLTMFSWPLETCPRLWLGVGASAGDHGWSTGACQENTHTQCSDDEDDDDTSLIVIVVVIVYQHLSLPQSPCCPRGLDLAPQLLRLLQSLHLVDGLVNRPHPTGLETLLAPPHTRWSWVGFIESPHTA